MLEFYPYIKLVHIWAISLSGGLFFLRAGASILGQEWPHLFAMRMISWLIDITLLTAAAMLWTILPKEMFENGWLHVKLSLVVLYIAIGFAAMRRTFKKPIRIGFYVLNIAVFATIYGIAKAHNPLGWFS